MSIPETPQQFSAQWDRTTRIRLTHHPKSRDGSSTFPTETLEDRPQEGGAGDHQRALPDPLQEAAEVAEVAEVAEEAEEAGEHSHYPGMHLPNQQRNF